MSLTTLAAVLALGLTPPAPSLISEEVTSPYNQVHQFLPSKNIADNLAQATPVCSGFDPICLQGMLMRHGPTFPVPKPQASGINRGLTSPSASYMSNVFGQPGGLGSTQCSTVTNSRIKKLLVTESVGPFRVTGLKPAVQALRQGFTAFQRDWPEFYSRLGTQGMLCFRTIQGSSNLSNHSWGTAIDITINGATDTRGDNLTQLGLILLHPYLQAQGFYWGAAFPTEDSMHFEVSRELIEQWRAGGQL